MRPRILFVDDEFNVLAGIKRHVRTHIEVELARGGAEALERLKGPRRYAAIVSDLKMPGVDGLRLLTQARALAPEVVRIILTGNLELRAAIAAINDAGVFRVLIKPCEAAVLVKTLDEAIDQHYNCTGVGRGAGGADGVVALLQDLLKLLSPEAFARTERLRGYARQIIETLDLRQPALLETAVQLSQIGCLAVDAELLQKVAWGAPLAPAEQARLDAHPDLGARLLAHVPRLVPIASMLVNLRAADPRGGEVEDVVTIGTRLLRVVTAYDALLSAAWPTKEIIERLQMDPSSFPPQMVAALQVPSAGPLGEAWVVSVQKLEPGMVFDDDLAARDGTLLASRGQQASPALVARIGEYRVRVGVPESVRVRVPAALDHALVPPH